MIRIHSRFVSIDERFSAVYIILIRFKLFSINIYFYFLPTGLTPQEITRNRAILGRFPFDTTDRSDQAFGRTNSKTSSN